MKNYIVSAAICSLMLLGGCATKTELIDVENDSTERAAGLEYRDFESAARKMVGQMLASGNLNKPGGGRYVLIISRIANNTLQRIDVDQLSKKIRIELINSGKVAVTNMEEEITIKENGVVDDSIRLKYLSFQNILNSIYKSLEKYKKDIDLSTINLTKNYNLSKKATSKQDFSTAKPLYINELNIKKEELSKSHFSKTTHNLYSKEEKTNIELGLKMHSILENINFQNPNLENLTPFEKKKVTSFINSGILKGTKHIYKEYEFIYEEENQEYHGIIDLLLIKENENIIVDYKLKHTTDEAYLKQLNGYKKYIENITKKTTKIYLYSILDEKLINLNEKALIN